MARRASARVGIGVADAVVIRRRRFSVWKVRGLLRSPVSPPTTPEPANVTTIGGDGRRTDPKSLDGARRAYQLGTSTPNLYRWIKEGRLSLLRVGGRSFITDAELDRFVAEAQVLSRATRAALKL